MTPEASPTPDRDYVLVPREQIEKLATKQSGYGMAYHSNGISSSAEIHLYGKRAEAAHWLMENGPALLAARPTPADDAERRSKVISDVMAYTETNLRDATELADRLSRLFEQPRDTDARLREALERINSVETYYLGENPGHRFTIPNEIRREYRLIARAALEAERGS